MRFLSPFLHFLFPPRCVHCKVEGAFLCSLCRDRLQKKTLHPRTHIQKEEWEHLNGLIYGVDYHQDPCVQALITQFKYRFNQEIADDLAMLMQTKLEQAHPLLANPIVLVPIPLHFRRQWERGFNQSELLCLRILKKFPLPLIIEPALKRVKYTTQQAKLNREERHKNLDGAFAVNPKIEIEPLNQGTCFLVDDVCSTGATLENAARTLKERGVKKVYGLVASRALR